MLSIVIPCYNEAGNIPLLIERFTEVVKANADVEIIFFDNGSTDNSAQVFESELKKHPTLPFRVVKIEKNQGYGHGILQGLRSAKGEVLSWTHADMQTDPLDVLTGFDLFDKNKSAMLLVKGKRRNRPWLDEFFTKGMELFASLMLKIHLNDINAQPKIFSKYFFDQIQVNAPLDFSLDLYFLYHATKNGQVLDFPVYFNQRLYGEAKGGGSLKTKYKLMKRTFDYILSLSKTLKTIH